jgi:transcriptional regulator with XRE-family HTH domain
MAENYGKVLKSIRKDKKLYLKDVKEKTGISIASLSLIETGKIKPRPTTIKKLSEVYEIDYFTLYNLLEKGE